MSCRNLQSLHLQLECDRLDSKNTHQKHSLISAAQQADLIYTRPLVASQAAAATIFPHQRLGNSL